jgi:excisionase family DNA binding protein
MTLLLTIREAATACQCSVGHLQAAKRAGELPFVRLGKVRGIRFRAEDLKEWIAGKIVGTVTSHKQELANLAKIDAQLNQRVTPHDR